MCAHARSCVLFAVTFNLLKGSETTFSKSLSGVGARFRVVLEEEWGDRQIRSAMRCMSCLFSFPQHGPVSSMTLRMECRGAGALRLSGFSAVQSHEPIPQTAVIIE